MRKKVDVAHLRLGMYVMELDRPWLDTPFLFQGFPIRTPEEIEQLRDLCGHVYIDTGRQIDVPSPASSRPKPAVSRHTTASPNNGAGPRPAPTTAFQEEIAPARRIHETVRDHVHHVFREIRLGKGIDVTGIRGRVRELAESIVRNPHALMWITQIKARDDYTARHSVDTCVLSLVFGLHMGLVEEAMIELGMAALLHDVGKIRVPLKVLNKSEPLTVAEVDIMRRHPIMGVQILTQTRGVSRAVVDVAYGHHERVNGTGYPRRLTGDAISLFSKMVAIVDIYDAMTSDRSYRHATSSLEAVKRIYSARGHELDGKLVEHFIQCVGIYPVGTLVELAGGEVGMVISVNPSQRLRPKVMLVLDPERRRCCPPRVLDLMRVHRTRDGVPQVVKKVLEPGSYGIDNGELLQQVPTAH